jgi:hypothetical protein
MILLGLQHQQRRSLVPATIRAEALCLSGTKVAEVVRNASPPEWQMISAPHRKAHAMQEGLHYVGSYHLHITPEQGIRCLLSAFVYLCLLSLKP